MNDNVGTPRSFNLDGISVEVAADANISFDFSKYDVEGQATTGDTMFVMKKKVPIMENVPVVMAGYKIALVKEKAESLSDITLSVTFADGTTYKGAGRIKADKWESETGKCNLTLIPKGDWVPFNAA